MIPSKTVSLLRIPSRNRHFATNKSREKWRLNHGPVREPWHLCGSIRALVATVEAQTSTRQGLCLGQKSRFGRIRGLPSRLFFSSDAKCYQIGSTGTPVEWTPRISFVTKVEALELEVLTLKLEVCYHFGCSRWYWKGQFFASGVPWFLYTRTENPITLLYTCCHSCNLCLNPILLSAYR